MNADEHTLLRKTFYQQVPNFCKDAAFKVIADLTEDDQVERTARQIIGKSAFDNSYVWVSLATLARHCDSRWRNVHREQMPASAGQTFG
jgi:hypothetical protein